VRLSLPIFMHVGSIATPRKKTLIRAVLMLGGKVAKTSDGLRLISETGTTVTIDSQDALKRLSPAEKLQWDHFVQVKSPLRLE